MGIEGSRGTSSLRSAVQRKREQFRKLMCEGLEQRLLLAADGPRLLSIAPNAGEILSVSRGNVLNESPRELVFRFDSDVSRASLAEGIQIFRSGGDNAFGASVDASNPNADVRIVPSFLDFGESNRIVIARFSQALEDDLYSVQVLGTGAATPITDSTGQTLKPRIAGTDRDTYQIDLELGTKIVAVVPQPIERLANGSLVQHRDKIEVYFNDAELYDREVTTVPGGTNPAVVDPAFYKLILTDDTISPQDDSVLVPSSIHYSPTLKKATLTFASNLDTAVDAATGGTFRLRIGSSANLVQVSQSVQDFVADPGATLDRAVDIKNNSGIIDASFSTIIRQRIAGEENANWLDYPGGIHEPGHRDIQDEDHHGNSPDLNGISTRYYSFMDGQSYGNDVQGRPLFSSITAEQKARVREVFEFFSMQMGIDFVERTGTVGGGDLQVVVGDMAPHGRISGPGDVAGVAGGNLAIMDGAEVWNNSFGFGSGSGGSFFTVAMHEIGHLLGFGHAYDMPPGNIMGSTNASAFSNGNPLEQIFPSSNDLVHGQYLYRPDNRDVDLYRFVVSPTQAGEIRIETVAERLSQASNLDTHLTLLKRDASGNLTIVSANNNYFSDDSFIQADLGPGEYFIAVTGKGNEDSNPLTPGSGSGATSAGRYELRIDFESSTVGHLSEQKFGTSELGSKLDGDSDGVAGGDFNFWFRVAAPHTGNALPAANGQPRTIYVDKAFNGAQRYGTLTNPFRSIPDATAVAKPGDIVRIVGDTRTASNLLDDRAYEIGNGGAAIGVLSDGASLEVPRGVTLMIDAGAVFKFAGSGILVGSNDATSDRSNAAIQVLGTPAFPVYMTSYSDQSLGIDTNPLVTTPTPSDWGGIEIRNDFDRAQGRSDREREGIFLNTISNADIRYGGGLVGSGANARVVSPIDLSEARPLIINNKISRSGSAAISADPNSFEETLFTEPRYQNVGAFVPDYSRVGPDIRSNTITNNSINGLFISIETTATGGLQTLNVAGRIDDSEITVVLGENLIIEGTPGGATSESTRPDVNTLNLAASAAPSGSGFTAAGIQSYVITYVDKFGQESLPSIPKTISVAAGQQVRLNNLPTATLDYVSRKIYRKIDGAAAAYELVANLNRDDLSFVDLGRKIDGNLSTDGMFEILRARRDGSLIIDPGTVIKSLGGRIEVGVGATFLAEGTQAKPIIFTSRLDDRFGAGGTFDTNNDGASSGTAGDWAGIISRHLGELSLDNTIVSFGGGNSRVPGGFASFNAIEIHQSEARIANSLIENNASGTGTRGTTNRDGRGINDEAAIFVLASQPIIINNIIRDNSQGTGTPTLSTAAISIDANSLNYKSVQDRGRSIGGNDRLKIGIGNYGPLISDNLLGGNAINGMNVRGATLTTESIWDDTDIVHVLQSEIVVPDLHTYGGLRLTSRSDESLVVKLQGATAGFTAGGRPLDITDRIGGSLQVIGSPGFPVVLTSLADDTIGAGFDYAGRTMVDTNNNGNATSPAAGSWRSVRFEPFANDRNVEQSFERESDLLSSTGSNDVPAQGENLGTLAPNLNGGDENLRLGFTVTGSIATPGDLDVYQFTGTAGTQIWIDIDQTAAGLDSVVELIDASGRIIALSDNSYSESLFGSVTYHNPALIDGARVNIMDQSWNAPEYSMLPVDVDFLGVNPLDAGFRVILPGSLGTENNYYIRVRSSNVTPVDNANGDSRDSTARLSDPQLVRDGLTVGQYKMQVRLQQTQEYSGSTVRYADVRYATTGIEALGMPFHSPLVGDFAEANPSESDNTPPAQAQALGNLLSTDRGSISVAGQFAQGDHVDFYRVNVSRDSIQQVSTTPTSHVSVVFDIDYADGLARPNTQLWIFDSEMRLVLTSDDSNIHDDQPSPERGNDASDLSRGSFGTRDAYIGPFELPQGDYVVAVSNKSQSPLVMRQFTDADAGGHSMVRVEPIDSIIRIAEDRFDTYNRPTVAVPPKQVAFDFNSGVDFNLSDVTLFAAQGRNVRFLNPLTGVTEAIYSTNGTSAVNFGPNTNTLTDIAVAPNGHAIGFQTNTGTRTDGNSGTFVAIDLGNGAPTTVASGLQTNTTREVTPATTPATFQVVQVPNNGGNNGVGMTFDGITYSGQFQADSVPSLWGVAQRGGAGPAQPIIGGTNNDTAIGIAASAGISKNVLYRLSSSGNNVGQAINPIGVSRGGVRTALGAGTNIVEHGYFVRTAGQGGGDSPIRNWEDADGVVRGLASVQLDDGRYRFYAVTDRGELMSLQVNNESSSQVWSDQYTVVNDDNGIPIAFTGVTVGPRNVRDGFDYSQMLFGTTATGRIYAFNTDGVLQPIFTGGRSYTTTATGLVGLSFSSLDSNLWHISRHNEGEDGHGREAIFNRSSDAHSGNNQSFRFGYANPDAGVSSQSGNYSGIYDVASLYNTVAAPGGARGALESYDIDLSEYSANDQPTLYFNYRLETQNSNSGLGDTNPALDAFRVYASTDSGRWILLGTNNSPEVNSAGNTIRRDFGAGALSGGSDEFDNRNTGLGTVLNRDVFGRERHTTEFFDNQGWRQARISLATFAGMENVKLRFEFSTGGDFRTLTASRSPDPTRNGIEFTAVPGAKFYDSGTNNGFTFKGERYEFDQGLVLNLPGGSRIAHGDTISIAGQVFVFSNDGAATSIPFDPSDAPSDISLQVSLKLRNAGYTVYHHPELHNVISVSALNGLPLPTVASGGVYAVSGIPNTTIKEVPGVAPGSEAIPIHLAMSAPQVRDAVRTALARVNNVAGQEDNVSVYRFHDNTILLHDSSNTSSLLNSSPMQFSLGRVGDVFGSMDSGGNALFRASFATQQNNVQGLQIDDIIIGLAERGETVYNAPTNNANFGATPFYAPIWTTGALPDTEIEAGKYQLEIRVGADYGDTLRTGELDLERAFDSNDRLTPSIQIRFDESGTFGVQFSTDRIMDGETFSITDGLNTARFEFDYGVSLSDPDYGVEPGRIRIPIRPGMSGRELVTATRDAINSPAAQAIVRVSAASGGEMRRATAPAATSNKLYLFGPEATNVLDGFGNIVFDSTVVRYGRETGFGEDSGDSNRLREQGQFMVSSTIVRNSLQYGINVDAAPQNQSLWSTRTGLRPYPGAVRNLVPNTNTNLAPGVVLANNIVYSNGAGAINISGDTDRSNGLPPTTLARVMNNTLFGNGIGIGVNVNEAANPYLLNNIVANFATGISVSSDSSGTIAGGNIYKQNGNNTAGPLSQSFAVNLASNEPLFVDPANGRFYLAPLSRAIDSSMASLESRTDIDQFKSSVGLPTSSLLAPIRDIYGLLRSDDPLVNTPAGLGQNVFVDRGAIDRVDMVGPEAIIMVPLDNDAVGIDKDSSATILELTEGRREYFEILLDESSGTGVDQVTVTESTVIITENGRRLVQGSDYLFGYSANSRTVRLTPLAGFWRDDSVYEITLVNQHTFQLEIPDGDELADGDYVAVRVAGTDYRIEFDSNGSSTAGAIVIPFTATSNKEELAAALKHVLDRPEFRSGGLQAFAVARDTLLVSGISTGATSLPVSAISPIRDIAGNALAANRPNSLTQFTIAMPEVQFDYGDAIERSGTSSNSGTLFVDNGARHALLPIDEPKLVLGIHADADSNGATGPSVDADDFDSLVTLSAGLPFEISTEGPARLLVTGTTTLVGETLTIHDHVNNTVVFRFSLGGAGVGANEISVNISSLATPELVAAKLAEVIQTEAVEKGLLFGISSQSSGQFVSLGGTSSHRFELSRSDLGIQRELSGNVALDIVTTGLSDGETLTIQDGSGNTLVFQLVDTAAVAPAILLPGRVAVNVILSGNAADQSSAEQIANALRDAINANIAAGRLRLPEVTVDGTKLMLHADDDDGVAFDGFFNPAALPVSVSVYASNAGFLDAWIDWNQDNDFDDANEQMITSIPVVAGLNTFEFATPADAEIGFTTARFRLSTTGGLSPTGFAIGGEVEDHLIEVLDGTPPIANDDPSTPAGEYRVLEDGVLTVNVADGVLANDLPATGIWIHDIDPFTSSVDPVAAPSNGTLEFVVQSTGPNAGKALGAFKYTPNRNFSGIDTFVYQIRNERMTSNVAATVTINVLPINDAPVGVDDNITIVEDNGDILLTPNTSVTWDSSLFTANDIRGRHSDGTIADDEADQNIRVIAAAIVGTPRAGESVSVDTATGMITYTPGSHYNSDINGPIIVRLTIEDDGVDGVIGANDSNNATPTLVASPRTSSSLLTINITPLNDRPVFTLDSNILNEVEDATPAARVHNIVKNVAAGPASATDEAAAQAVVSFDIQVVTNHPDAASLFAVAPHIAGTGSNRQLEYTLAPDINWANVGGNFANDGHLGDIYLEIVAVDDGSDVAPGNINRSLVQTLTIRIQPVNDAPEFNVPATHTSLEDAGVVTVPNFATDILSGRSTATDETRDQTTQFRVVNYDANFFASAPTISETGTLVYEVRPNLNRNYTSLVTTPAVTPVLNPVIVVELVDNGPTGGSNVHVSIQKSFTIDVTPVNDPPVLVPYTVQAVEDATLTVSATNVLASSGVGPIDELTAEGQSNRITRVDSTSLQGGTIVAEIDAATGSVISFQYTPAANYFGEDSITYSVTDSGDPTRTTDHTIVFTVSTVNDAPVFTPGPDVVLLEDALAYSQAWATGIAPGPQNEADLESQSVHFELSVTPPALFPNFFAVAPAISAADGVLTFTLAQDATGSAVIAVVLKDDGPVGGPNNHVNASSVHLLTITASPVNDAPVFSLAQTQLTDSEDSLPELKSIPLVTGIAPSRSTAADEIADQTVSFEVTTNIPASNFIVAPHIVGTGAARSLEYQLAANVNRYTVGGDIVFTIVAIDSGDSSNPPANIHRSEPQQVTLSISEVNDNPLFELAFETLTIAEDSPLQVFNGFYRNAFAGPDSAIDELTGDRAETVEVTLSINPAAVPFFVVPPTLNANGDLQFQLRQDANSDFATVLGVPDLFDISITATDNGTDDGTAAPRSSTLVLKLNVTPVNDPPFFTISDTRVTANEDQGVVEVVNFAQQIRPAFTLSDGQILAIDEQSQTLEFVLTVGNQTLFTELPTIDSTGRLRFLTAPDQNGTSVITARLLDNGPTGPAPNNHVGPIVTFTIAINAINDAPQFTIPSQLTVAEDAGVVSINGFSTEIRPGPETAIDENRQTLNFTLVSYDTNLFEVAPTLQVDGTLSFKTRSDVNSATPGINRVVEFRLSDSGAQSPAPNSNQSLPRSFTLNITPVNDAPIPDIHEVSATEDTPITITAAAILAGDAAGPADEVAAGQTLRITQVESTSELGGTVTSVVENGRIVSIRYVPPANAVGDDYVRYVVTDNGSPERSATGVIHVQIGSRNDAPQFTAGPNLTVLEDAAPYSATWATNVLAGPENARDEWSGPNAQNVSFTLTPRTAGFFAVPPAINADGVLTFQLARDVNGSVVVEVVAEDDGPRGAGNAYRSAIHLLTITGTALNDPPGFILGDNITLTEDSGPYSGNFVTNITGAEGQNNTPPTGTDELLGRVHFEVTNNNNAMFSVQPSIDANGRLTFTAAANAAGSIEVYVVGIDDGASSPPHSNRSEPKTFTIHLESVNDAPLAVNDRYNSDEDTPVVVSAPGILANDRDVDLPGDTIQVVVPTTPLVSRLGATVTLNADGSFHYDPTNAAQVQRLGAGQEVVDTFTYFIQDSHGAGSNAGTVSITLTGSNDRPVAVNDSFQINAQAVTSLNVLANDTDVDSTIDVRTVEIGRTPTNGTVSVLSSGRIEYRPNANFVGEDSFTYWVHDAQGLASNAATVTVYSSVPPVAVNDLYSMVKGREIVLSVLGNDHDPDPNGGLDPTSVQIARAPEVGTATVGTDGKITYKPTPDFVGTASFQYYVTDLSGQPSNVATVTIRVLSSLHQNPENHLDVNADGYVSPIDVLIIVNDINYRGSRNLPDDFVTPPYLDVNGNGGVDPLDALILINHLNARGNAGAGGEGEGLNASVHSPVPTAVVTPTPVATGLTSPNGLPSILNEVTWTPIDVEILSAERFRQLAEAKWIEVQTEILSATLDDESDFIGSPTVDSVADRSDDWFVGLTGETTEELSSHDLALTTEFWDEL